MNDLSIHSIKMEDFFLCFYLFYFINLYLTSGQVTPILAFHNIQTNEMNSLRLAINLNGLGESHIPCL